MKTLIMLTILSCSVSTFASQANYCKDQSKTVLYTKAVILPGYSHKYRDDSIGRGELVTNLKNGTSVLIPCNEYSMDPGIIEALIVDQSRIFSPIEDMQLKDNIVVLGINKKTSKVLMKETTLKLFNYYFVM